MKSMIKFFSALTTEKTTVLLLLTPILTILLGIKGILLGLAIIIFFDLLTGLMKSLYNKQKKCDSFNCSPFRMDFWHTLSSEGMRATWKKTYEYGIGIVVVATLETMILGGVPLSFLNRTFGLTELAVSTAAVVEVYSIFENIEAVTNGNILKRIIGILPSNVRNWFGEKKEEDGNKNNKI